MTRRISLVGFAAAQCVFAGMIAAAPARAAQIPQYFFSQWTVTANCTEAQAGPAARVQAGLQFKISQSADGTYTLQTINASGKSYFMQTKLRERTVIRLGLGNILTGEDNVRRAWDLVCATRDSV